MEGADFDTVALGRAVVVRRERIGWTTGRLSERSGVADPYLRRLEKGKVGSVGVDVVVRLARALGTTPDTLIHEAGAPTAIPAARLAATLYASLDSPARAAFLRSGESLQQLQAEYADLQRRVAEERTGDGAERHPEDEAAFDNKPAIDAERAEMEDMDPK